MVTMPAGAAFVLQRLKENGFQGYVVGGCVRDSLLGRAPKDWDICTDALPEEMQRVFRDQHVIETGLKHGTLTVMYDHEPYEVTTFRVVGVQECGGRPGPPGFHRQRHGVEPAKRSCGRIRRSGGPAGGGYPLRGRG